MMPRLHRHWKRILSNAWSVRLIALAAVLSGIEVALPFLQLAMAIPPGLFAALSGVATAGAFAARLVAQANMEDLET